MIVFGSGIRTSFFMKGLTQWSLLFTEEVRQAVADGLLQLVERAGGRLAVRAPADELRRVPEPGSLHVVVAHLDHALRAQRYERQVLAYVPPAVLGAARGAHALAALAARTTVAGHVRGPVPRVAVERG